MCFWIRAQPTLQAVQMGATQEGESFATERTGEKRPKGQTLCVCVSKLQKRIEDALRACARVHVHRILFLSDAMFGRDPG